MIFLTHLYTNIKILEQFFFNFSSYKNKNIYKNLYYIYFLYLIIYINMGLWKYANDDFNNDDFNNYSNVWKKSI